MTIREATTAEVRNYFKSYGYPVRISRDGHVKFRRLERGPWLEGRWVSEYKFDDEDDTIYLP